jgi:hypothetical protein
MAVSLQSSPQRRLGPQRVKGAAFFTRRGPSLRWDDGGRGGPLLDSRPARAIYPARAQTRAHGINE